jgi:tetratricopeptide (TPR) repeat protein
VFREGAPLRAGDTVIALGYPLTGLLCLFYRAIELDPDFASAYAAAAMCYTLRKDNNWVIDRASEITETAQLARRALSLGKDDAVAFCRSGFALAFVAHEADTGVDLINRALVLNPNLSEAWGYSGVVRYWIGTPDLAIEHLDALCA